MTHQPGGPDFLIHKEGDTVAVAVRDLSAGPVSGAYLHGEDVVHVDLADDVPLGHKLALADVKQGQDITEYGQRVGTALRDISRGGYVHVHNMGSARWRNSVA